MVWVKKQGCVNFDSVSTIFRWNDTYLPFSTELNIYSQFLNSAQRHSCANPQMNSDEISIELARILLNFLTFEWNFQRPRTARTKVLRKEKFNLTLSLLLAGNIYSRAQSILKRLPLGRYIPFNLRMLLFAALLSTISYKECIVQVLDCES